MTTRRLALILFSAIAACHVVLAASAAQTLDVLPILEPYEHGDYATGREAILSWPADDRSFGTLFVTGVQHWIVGQADQRWRRTIVAASVALEVAHALRELPADRAARYLVWAAKIMNGEPRSTAPAEHWWYLASIAGMLELDDPWTLTTGRESGSIPMSQLASRLGAGGHLATALRKYPDEQRFRLVSAEAQESPVFMTGLVPSLKELVQRREASAIPTNLLEARRLSVLSRAASVQEVFRSLPASPELASEVELHLAYLDAVQQNWMKALGHLDRILADTRDPFLVYNAQYICGLVSRNLGDHPAALAAFELANRSVPGARAAATQVAAELLIRAEPDDRVRAYSLLRAASASPADTLPPDPWRLFPQGDARLWNTYMAQLRQALR